MCPVVLPDNRSNVAERHGCEYIKGLQQLQIIEEGMENAGRLSLAAALLLPSAYKFAQRFAPVIPYEVRYMIHDKGISNQQISNKILPISVYSRVLFIFLAAPACALFSYHGTLMLGALAVLAEYSFLLLGKSILSLQFMQLFRAMGASIEVVFPAYLFLLVTEDKFQVLTSCTDAASSISHFGASELGQALIHEGISIRVLLYISMGMVALSVLICVILPRDPQAAQCAECPLATNSKKPPLFNLLSVCRLKGISNVIKETWQHPYVQLLSFWWAFDVAGHAMAGTYMLNLFEEIDSTSLYNGHVIAATEVMNFVAALSAIPFSKLVVTKDGGMAYYSAGSVLIGILLISMPYTSTLWVAYPAYVAVVGMNRVLLCIVHVQCARYLENKEYVLLFSLNTLAGRLIQTIFQAVIEMIGPSIFVQYYIFGSSFLAMAVIFLLLNVYKTWNLKDSDSYYQPLTRVEVLS